MTSETAYQAKPWLASYEKGVSATIDYENACLPDFLARSADRFPDNAALNFQGYQITYRQLKEMTDRFAAALAAFGIGKGDRVAILLPNLIPCVAAYYAILQIGGIAVMNNPLYSDRELEHQFNDSGSRLLVTLDLLGNRMIDLRPKTRIEQIVYTSIGDYLPFPKNLLFPLVGKKKKLAADVKPAEQVYRWKEVIAGHEPNPPQVDLSFEEDGQRGAPGRGGWATGGGQAAGGTTGRAGAGRRAPC